ncbi:MAG TPA: polyprenyl synthetase family protein [Pyrinomonadaceae bacterium]|jgi:geranylgeranyl pyrophosphate synthase
MLDRDIGKQAFEHLSPLISQIHSSFIQRILKENPGIEGLLSEYLEYSSRDSLFPRPILTFFGYVSNKTEFSWAYLDDIKDLIILSQLLRDFFAIHDDIVDEDEIKFGKPTLPIVYSSFPGKENRQLTKQGKDLSLFLGDFLIFIINELILSSNKSNEIKIELFKLLGDTIRQTLSGQIKELLFQKSDIMKISNDNLLSMYSEKAANYCYVFPFELGLILSNASIELKGASRNILYKIGIASQIIDDIVGVFPNLLNQEKITLGEILNLRRTILLVNLAHRVHENDNILEIISKSSCNMEEANLVLKKIEEYKIIAVSLEFARNIASNLEEDINVLQIAPSSKMYLTSLLKSRVLDNLNRIQSSLEEDE